MNSITILLVPIVLATPIPNGLALRGAERDSSGTTAVARRNDGSQHLMFQQVASRSFEEAEGTGLEPATPFGAPHFQCGRSPIRLPSGDGVRALRAAGNYSRAGEYGKV